MLMSTSRKLIGVSLGLFFFIVAGSVYFSRFKQKDAASKPPVQPAGARHQGNATFLPRASGMLPHRGMVKVVRTEERTNSGDEARKLLKSAWEAFRPEDGYSVSVSGLRRDGKGGKKLAVKLIDGFACTRLESSDDSHYLLRNKDGLFFVTGSKAIKAEFMEKIQDRMLAKTFENFDFDNPPANSYLLSTYYAESGEAIPVVTERYGEELVKAVRSVDSVLPTEMQPVGKRYYLDPHTLALVGEVSINSSGESIGIGGVTIYNNPREGGTPVEDALFDLPPNASMVIATNFPELNSVLSQTTQVNKPGS